MHFLSTTKTAALPSLRCGPSLSVRQTPNARSFQSFVLGRLAAKLSAFDRRRHFIARGSSCCSSLQ
jgi:hypothetical protein